eukprot:427703-Prymnesium_polylepis.1
MPATFGTANVALLSKTEEDGYRAASAAAHELYDTAPHVSQRPGTGSQNAVSPSWMCSPVKCALWLYPDRATVSDGWLMFAGGSTTPGSDGGGDGG